MNVIYLTEPDSANKHRLIKRLALNTFKACRKASSAGQSIPVVLNQALVDIRDAWKESSPCPKA